MNAADADLVRQRLDDLIQDRGEDYASLSRLLGRNQAYVQQFIKRGIPRRLSENDRRLLAIHFDVPEAYLGGPTGLVAQLAPAGEPADPMQDAGYVLIPAYDVRAAAGDGALADAESVSGALAFQARWARTIASGGIKALSVVKVEGDSMFPTLADGDNILIDTADRERLRDGIYVLRVEDALMVKRLSLSPAGRKVTIRSDNPAYPTWPDCDPADISVIGRVVWVGRKL
jgi:phage repressor protein C with HTH and peptisase S24 domain